MPATGIGARFRVKVSKNTNSDCKDAALSSAYRDVYDGQGNVFSSVAGQDPVVTGAIAFGNSAFPVEYITEFPMPDPPKFGEAELSGLELNLHFTDINQNYDYTPLNLEIYKLKESLLTEGNFLALKNETKGGSDIYFASSTMDGMMGITENWTGAGEAGSIDLGAFTSSTGYTFLYLDDAYDNLPGWIKFDYGYSKDTLFRKVGSVWKGEDIIRIKPNGDNWKSYTNPQPGYAWTRPRFKDDDVKDMIQMTGTHIDASDQDGTKLDITDTILEHLDYTEDYFVGDENEDKNYSAYTRPYIKSASSPTNGVVFSMSHFTAETESGLDKSRNYSLRSGGNANKKWDGPYQEIRTWFSIPSPQRLETWSTKGNYYGAAEQEVKEHTGVQVEFVINIDRMNSRQKRQRTTTGGSGSRYGGGTWSCTGKEEGTPIKRQQKFASMARSFIITFTDRPPESHEKFHNFVYNMKNDWPQNIERKGTPHPARVHGKNPKIRKRDNSAPEDADHARFYGIAFWNDGTSTVGKLRAITSNLASGGDGNEQFFGAAVNSSSDGGDIGLDSLVNPGNLGFPIFEYTDDTWIPPSGNELEDPGYWLYSYVPRQQLDLDGNENTAGIGLGQWFKVVMSYSGFGSKINIFILDMNDNIINYAKFPGWYQKHTTGSTGSPKTPDNFVGDSMPRYCTLWCLHEGIDGAGNDDDADYTTDEDTYTEVMIDSISIRGFETSVNNKTMGTKNTGGSSPRIEIQPDQKLWNQRQYIKPILEEQEREDPVGAWGAYLITPHEDKVGASPLVGSIWKEGADGEDDSEGVMPTYLSFGFKSSTALELSDTHLFLGGYTCDNLPNSDGTDVNKRPATINAWLGNQAPIGKILEDRNTPQTIVTNGASLVDYFTRKGFLTIDGAANPAWERRENSLVATKITDISKISEGKIVVADIGKLLASEEEEYVIYRATDVFSKFHATNRWNKVSRKGLLVNHFKVNNQTIIFNNHQGKLHLADDGVNPLCVDEFLDELYISPYRYWLIVELWNIGFDGTMLPDKTYSHVLSQNDAQSPTAGDRVLGMTHNEFLYSDSPKLSNQWYFKGDPVLLIYENTVDYGYGTFEEKETGYLNKPMPITIPDTHTKVDISGLVDIEQANLLEAGSLVSLYVKTDANGTAKLSTNKVSTTANRPFLNVIYTDALPELSDFKVQPNEEDPFYPTYTWSTGSDDLWYGFLIQDDKAIEHQYHSAVAHIPLNETGTDTYLYRYDGLFGGSIASRIAAISNVNKTISIEGLAGNCLEFDGSTDIIRYIQFDNSYTQPTGEMSLVAHFVASVVDATHYIVTRNNQFELYVDSSGYIHAKVHYDSSNSVNLKSISLVPTDGMTPVNVIVTLDVGIPTGNVKLFVNGKLEDQSGVKTTDGSVSNWKIDTTLNNPGGYLRIGIDNSSTTHQNRFIGKIEEIVIYNKAIYPVVPQTGELSLFKPISELSLSNIASGKSIVSKLFIKDYHNIRGTTTNQVTSSSMVAYRKSGVGLKTN